MELQEEETIAMTAEEGRGLEAGIAVDATGAEVTIAREEEVILGRVKF